MTQESTVTLIAMFDADQISSTLDHAFVSPNMNVDPTQGVRVGSVYLVHGQKLVVQVWGGGLKKLGFSRFEVQDCSILTTPQVTQLCTGKPTLFAPPSPFIGQTVATNALKPLTFEQIERDDTPDYLRIKTQWTGSFTVGDVPGRWELSFLITLKVFRGPEDKQGEYRVFSFDPECEVGGGI